MLGGALTVLACGDPGGVPRSKGVVHWAIDSRVENARPGTRAWRLEKPAHKHEVEGYALRSTVAPGETVAFAVSVSLPQAQVTWSAYRLGYYKGLGGRLIGSEGSAVLVSQKSCTPLSGDGLVSCGWPASVNFKVPTDAPGGTYLLKLTRVADGFESYVPFVVRQENERADVLVVLPTSTWAAYNNFGGTSLYEDDDDVPSNTDRRGYRVSYDRPFAQGYGTGTLLSNERSAITWLESQSLRISYATAEAFDETDDILPNSPVLVLPGHDEYWTELRRQRTQTAVGRGMSLLLLSANTSYWRVRLDASADGRPARVITCFKGAGGDTGSPLTHRFRDDPDSEPEDALFGVMYRDRLAMVDVDAPVLIGNTHHWAFEGTGLEPGDVFWRVNGYELDSMGPGAPTDTTVLATSPLLSLNGGLGWGNMAVRETASGALVFAAGGLDFARALSAAELADTKAQRLVANVLYRALKRPLPQLKAFLGWREANVTSTVDRVRTAQVFAGVPGDRGTDDGPRGVGRLRAPLALAVAPDGSLLVTDGTSGVVRKVEKDGSMTTITGFPRCSSPIAVAADHQGRIWVVDGDYGVVYERAADGTVQAIGQRDWTDVMADGPADIARFAYPAGLALSRDEKTLWVADRNGGALRTVDLTSNARTVATVARGLVGRPVALAMSTDGGLYVQDIGSRVFLWKGGKATTVAGSGTLGYADGPAAQARFVGGGGLALLPSGALLISDPGNYRIRKLLAGQVSTFAGNGRGSDRVGDPSALILPAGLAVGPDRRVYVAEAGNATIRVIVP